LQLVKPTAGLSPKPGCSNATGDWYLCIDKDADGVYNEAGESSSITRSPDVSTNPNLTIGISGTKCNTSNTNGCTAATDPSCIVTPVPLCNNWVVLFSAKVAAAIPEVKAEVWNTARINYLFNSTLSTHSTDSVHYIINTGKAKIPDFREVTP
jgi:hypothetical protein